MSTKSKIVCMIVAAALVSSTVRPAFGEEYGKRDNSSRSKTAAVDAKTIDVNRIECFFQNDGSVGENPVTGGDGFFYPNGQRNKSIVYTGGLWFLAKVNGEIRSAANFYSSEFQPGAILSDGQADDPADAKYVIYRYNKGDAVDPAAVEQGCPPEVMGDQMLFCVYNDLGSHANLWDTQPLGIEVQQTAFALDSFPDPVKDMLFIRFHVVNKGTNFLEDAYFALFFDPDLGQANDDYLACDSSLHLAYVYNGDSYDEKYGTEVPSMGCDILQGPLVPSPGDSVVLPDGSVLANQKYLDMTAFFWFVIVFPDPSPTNDEYIHAYGYCYGHQFNGQPWMSPTGELTSFPFSGDPVAGTGWLMSSMTSPKDVRMGSACGPFSMEPGEYRDFIVALVVGLGQDHLSSVTRMKFNDSFAKNMYKSNFSDAMGTDDPAAILPSKYSISNHPNPFNPVTMIEYSLCRESEVALAVFDLQGRMVRILAETQRKPSGWHSVQWDGKDDRGMFLPSGMYVCRMKAGQTVRTHKMILAR